MKDEDASSDRKRLVLFSALYITFYAGAFFGYGPMQLMLEENGAFEERCNDNDDNVPCASQTAQLLNVQLVALLTLVFSPLFGLASDRYGAVRLMYLSAFCGCGGLGLLTLATSIQNWDNVLFLAFFSMGVMAVSSIILVVQTGMLFQGRTRQRVISVLNTLIDAGALTYLGLWGIMEATGTKLEIILLAYLGAAVVCFGGAVYFWRIVGPVDVEKDLGEKEEAAHDPVNGSTREETFNYQDTVSTMDCVDSDNAEGEYAPGSREEGATSGQTAVDFGEDTNATTHRNESMPDCQYVLIAMRPPLQQLKSKQFVTLVVFFSLHGARNLFTLTTARDFLAFLGDDENLYLTIFTLLITASVLALPLMDWVLNRNGYHVALQAVNLLAITHGIIQVSSSNLNVQVLSFVIFSFYRCFLFNVVFSFLPTFVGVSVVGRAAGIMTCAFGVLLFINIPLASLAIKQFDGNFFWPYLFYTVVTIPLVFAAWLLSQGIKKEAQARRTIKEAHDMDKD